LYTPTLQKYRNLKGLPNKTFSCIRCHWYRMHDFCARKPIISRRIRSRIQKGFRPWIRGPGSIVWWKNRRSKISWHCPFNATSMTTKTIREEFWLLKPNSLAISLTLDLDIWICLLTKRWLRWSTETFMIYCTVPYIWNFYHDLKKDVDSDVTPIHVEQTVAQIPPCLVPGKLDSVFICFLK
jgi:hypothetical protein